MIRAYRASQSFRLEKSWIRLWISSCDVLSTETPLDESRAQQVAVLCRGVNRPISLGVSNLQNKSKKLSFVLLAITFLSLVVAIIHFFGDSDRTPAAINRKDIYSQQRPQDPSWVARELLATAEIKSAKLEAALVLRHFNIEIAGQRLSFCQAFDRLEVRFEAEGMATNGIRPTLIIDGPCEISKNGNDISPIFIPIADLKGHKASPGAELSFSPHRQFTYQIQNFEGEWPSHWVLTDIRGYKKDQLGQEIKIGRREIYTHSPRPLQMIW